MISTSRLLCALVFPVSLLAATQASADLSAVPSGNYEVDPTHAYLNFQYTHLGLSKPTLSFDDFDINLTLDNADPSKSTIDVSIDAGSIEAGSDIWKHHLIGDNFFAVANNPTITFTSTSIEAAGDNAYTVTGDLTIKGTTKPVSLDVIINGAMNHPMSGKPVIGMSATGQLLRSDFGLGKFAPNISDEVELMITSELNKTN